MKSREVLEMVMIYAQQTLKYSFHDLEHSDNVLCITDQMTVHFQNFYDAIIIAQCKVCY